MTNGPFADMHTYSYLRDWARDELSRGERIKASRITRVADRMRIRISHSKLIMPLRITPPPPA